MTNEYRKHTDHGHDRDEECADPPHPPKDECATLPTSPKVPELPEAEPCEECPSPDCQCPTVPSKTSNCIEELIAKQALELAAAEKSKAFKTSLEALLGKAKAASQEYTQDAYEKLSKRWVEQDGEIAKLIHTLVCAVPCWRCVIECHICQPLDELRTIHQQLYREEKPYDYVNNLYDQQYWHTRDKDKKERIFNRIKDVLTAWETPAKTIDKILTDNAKAVSDAGKAVGNAPGSVLFDLFIRIIPMHLAIAPVRGLNWATKAAPWKTNIRKEYTDFCPCDTGIADRCCGVDFGEGMMRQQLLGPQPYLIDPNNYFELICCIVQERYEPAKNELGKAEAELAAITDKIKNLSARLLNMPKSFEKDVKGSIPSEIDCQKYEPAESDSKAS